MKTLLFNLLNSISLTAEDANALRKKEGVYGYFKEAFEKKVSDRAKEFNQDIAKLNLRIYEDDDEAESQSKFFSGVTRVSMERMDKLHDKIKSDPLYAHMLKVERAIKEKNLEKARKWKWYRDLKKKIRKPFEKIAWAYEFATQHLVRLYWEFHEYYQIKKIEKALGVRKVYSPIVKDWIELNTEETFERAKRIRKGIHLKRRMDLIRY